VDVRNPLIRLTRRDALQLGAWSAALSLLPALPGLAAGIRAREIPSSGESIPVVGLGTSRVFDIDPDDDKELADCRAVVAALLAAGGKLIDSSPMYGSAESVSGAVAAQLGLTDSIFWATKVWADGGQAGIAQMQYAMRLFGAEQIDLMQIHNLRGWQEHLPILRRWKEEGKIRYIGITHSRSSAFGDVEKVIDQTELDFVQLNYSLAEREAEERLLPICADNGIATLINRPFARGALFGKVRGRPLPEWSVEFGVDTWAQFFLKFILSNPAATCVIPATRQPEHMVDNVGAGLGALPDEAQRRAMIEFFAAL